MSPGSEFRRDITPAITPDTRAATRTPSALGPLDPEEFSVVVGGPLFQLLRRLHLSGDALELIRLRVVVFVCVAWLPLLVLSLLEGQALGGGAAVPFVYDVEAHVRLLVALPLLIVAEVIVNRRMRLVVRQFLERDLIPQDAMVRLHEAIASARRWRNSTLAELLLLAVVYLVGVMFVWRHFVALSTTATWYATPGPGGMTLSWTGNWYAYVTLPIFQFLLVRWYYRVLIWNRFLWQVSRLSLSLIPTHPDRVAGLGFLANISYAFTPLALAHGALLAGSIANRIFYVGATLTDFKAEMGVVVLFLLVLVFAPFLMFASQLSVTKRTGLREYGTLAERYVREFDTKWLRGGTTAGEPLVGSADIQSLADLGNSFEIVKTMRLVPVTRDAVLSLVGAALAPLVPLLLTMMSLEELLKKLAGVLF